MMLYILSLAASGYEIRYSSQFNSLNEANFDIGKNSTLVEDDDLLGGSLTPALSGTTQIITFVARNETTYYLAMRTLDIANNTSPISNIISFKISVVPSEASRTIGGYISRIALIFGLLLVFA